MFTGHGYRRAIEYKYDRVFGNSPHRVTEVRTSCCNRFLVLDDVIGMGPKRKKALLKAFGSFGALRNATLEEIKQTRTVPEQVAEDVYAVLEQYNSKSETHPQEQSE